MLIWNSVMPTILLYKYTNAPSICHLLRELPEGKISHGKGLHEKPLQVSDKLVQLYSFYYISLCQKIWEEVIISILINLTSFFPFSSWVCLVVIFDFSPVLISSQITYISFCFLLVIITCLFYFTSTWICSYETHLSCVVFLLKLALLKG